MLTDLEKLEIKTILEVKNTKDWLDQDSYSSQRLDHLLANLSEAQSKLLKEVLTEWDSVKFSTGKLSGEFKQDPAVTRNLLKNRVISLIGFDPVPGIESRFNVGRG